MAAQATIGCLRHETRDDTSLWSTRVTALFGLAQTTDLNVKALVAAAAVAVIAFGLIFAGVQMRVQSGISATQPVQAAGVTIPRPDFFGSMLITR